MMQALLLKILILTCGALTLSCVKETERKSKLTDLLSSNDIYFAESNGEAFKLLSKASWKQLNNDSTSQSKYTWVKISLPEIDRKEALSLGRCRSAIVAYNDTKIIKRFGTPSAHSIKGVETSNYLPIISIDPRITKNIYILFNTNHFFPHLQNRCNTFLLGDHDSILMEYLSEGVPRAIVGVILFACSICLFAYWGLIKQTTILYLALFNLAASYTWLGSVDWVWFLTGSTQKWWGYWYLSFFLFPIFFILYLGEIYPRLRKIIRKIIVPNIIILLFFLYSWNFVANFEVTEVFMTYIALVMIEAIFLIFSIYKVARNGYGYSRVIAITHCTLFAITLYDCYRVLTTSQHLPNLSSISVLVMTAVQFAIFNLEKHQKIVNYQKDKLTKAQLVTEQLEAQIKQRTTHLTQKTKDLAQANQKLLLGNKLLKTTNDQLELVNNKNQLLLSQISYIDSYNLKRLLDAISKIPGNDITKQKALDEVSQLKETLAPLTNIYRSEQEISEKKIAHLALKPDQKILKVALGSLQSSLDQSEDPEKISSFIRSKSHHVLVLGPEFLDYAEKFKTEFSHLKIVLLTSDQFSKHINNLLEREHINNLVFGDNRDPTFSLRNMSTTISKIINEDFFGISKYVAWGTKVREFTVNSNPARAHIIDTMDETLKDLGMRRSHISRALLICDEMLMNALYDAPTNEDGTPKYNHLSRTVDVTLSPDQQGVFQFAFDGATLALSVQDPFGALTRETILKYVKTCYEGNYGSINKEQGKAGGGMGLFQILAASDLLIVNVKPGIRTEFISLINVASKAKSDHQSISFQFFDVS